MKMKKRTAVLLGAVIVLLGANIAIAHDWWFWHQHKQTLGINITAANAISAEAARADWGEGVYNVMNLPSVAHHSDVSVLDGDYGDTGWAGLAEVISYFNHCHAPLDAALEACSQSFPGIAHAHVRLNTFYYPPGTPNLNTGGAFDPARGVFCQEIGHALGLDHSPDGCMGKGYFDGLLNENVVTSHSDDDLNAKYGGAPLGAVAPE